MVCRWVAFPCPFQAAQLPCPRHPALNSSMTTILCLPVPQVPVSIHGPAGCHVTQRGAAFRVSQPLFHGCWLRVLGRKMGRRQGFGAGGVVPVNWHPASLLAVGGGVSQGTCVGAHCPLIWTSPYFQVQVRDRNRCWGRSLRAGQVCGEPGVRWAGPKLLVLAVSPGHGEEQELIPPGSLCCCRGSWRVGGPRTAVPWPWWLGSLATGLLLLPGQGHISSMQSCAVALVGGCPGHIFSPL